MSFRVNLSDENIYEIIVDESRFSEIYISKTELDNSVIMLHGNVMTILGKCHINIAYQSEKIAKRQYDYLTVEL